MVSVGSVSIDLTLNRSQFDNDLRKLSQETVPDLTLQAKLDTRDFDRQIKGLTGFLPTLSIPVELDLAQFKQQVSQLGKESVSIQVGLDRSQFDHRLIALQQEKFALSLKIEVDTGEAEQQIKGLTKFLPSLSIPVELDDENFKAQLQGIKDATKNLDCIPLEICPDVDGLKQKLKTISSVDLDCLPLEICPDVEDLKRKLKAIGNVDIDCIPVDLCPDVKSFDKKVKDAVGQKGYSTTVGLDTDDFGKQIEHSFETALRKVEGKGIFGNLVSTIAAPLKFVGSLFKESISGAFLGVGLPIGEQLGHGIAKGVEGQVNQVIGSVEILGEKIAQKLPGSVSAKIQQVPLLKALFSQESVQDAQKELASFLKESVVGADEILVETLAQTTRKKQQTATVRQEAGQEAGRQYDRALAESPKDAITQDLIKGQLKQASRAADTASGNLAQFQQETSALVQAAKPEDREKIREESLLKQAELLRKQEAAAKEVAKLQAQLNQSRSRTSSSVSQLEKVGIDTSDVTQAQKNLENITAKGKERTEALTAQIKALYAARQNAQERFDAAIESKDVTGARSARVDAAKSDAEIAVVEQNFKEYTKVYREAASQAEKELKQAQASLLKATAFPDKSLEQLESSITPRQKLNLVGLKASAESGVSQIQLQKDFLQDDLNKQTAGIGGDTGRAQAEGLRDKLKARSDRLRETIDNARQKGDTSSSQASVSELNATLEQLRLVDNTLRPLEALETEIKGLDAVLESAKKQKEQIDKAVDTKVKSIEQAEARRQKTVALSKNPQQEAGEAPPQIYTDIVQQSAQLAGLQPIPQELIPKLEPSTEVAGRGDYNAKTNTYRIRPDLHQQLQTNDIEQISEEAVGNIVHEIYHAFQHSFGKAIADNTGKPAVNLQPTPEELLLVRDKVESSVSIQPDSRKDLSRELEIGANVFQSRNTPVVTDQLKRQQYEQQALSLGGVGGARISLTEVNKLVDEDISPFLQLAKELNVDVGKTKEALISKINSIRERSDAAGAKSIDIKSLSTEEIKTVVGEYEQLLKEIEQIRAIVPGLRAKAQSKASETQELKEELTIQMQKPQLKRLAKDLGISGISNKNKPEMVEAIVQSGVAATDIKAKLPTFNIPTEEILIEAQKVLQLTSEELTLSTKALVNSFKLKLKSAQGTFLDKERLSELQQILLEIDKAELVYIAAKSKTLDEGVKSVLDGRILSLQKARVATNSEIKSALPGAASIKGQGKSQAAPAQQQGLSGDVDAEALFRRRGLEEDFEELFGNEPIDTGAKAKRTTRRAKSRFNSGRVRPKLDLVPDEPLPSEQIPTIDDDDSVRNLPEIKYTTPVEHVPSLSGDFDDPNNNFARISGFPGSYEEILAEQKSKSLVPIPSIKFPHSTDVNPTLSGDFADPNNNFARIPGFPSSYEEIVEQEIRSREASVRQNARNLPEIKYTTPVEHVPSLSGDFDDPNNNFARIPGFPSSYEEILAEQKSKSLVPLPSMGFPHPKDVNPTLSGDFDDPNNNFARIPGFPSSYEEIIEQEIRSREASVRQNARNLPEIKYTTPVEHVPSLSGDFDDPNNNFARIPGFPSSYEEILAEQKSKSLVPLPFREVPHPKDVNPSLNGDFDDPNNNFARIPGFPSSYEEILAEQKSKSLVPLTDLGFPHPKDVNPTLSGDFVNPNGPTEKTTFYTADIPVIKPISIFPEQEKSELAPDVLNRKLREQSKRVEDSSARLDRRLKKQEEEYLRSVEKRVAKNSDIVDKTIKEIETGANEQVKETENNVNFDKQIEKRKSRRNAARIQQKYGLEDTDAPRVEAPIPEVKSTALSLGSVLRDIKDSRVESVKKQALALGQQTQILLADIQTQIVLGDNARKESLVLESQIKENERSLDKILNAIGKAKAGKDPEQSAEHIQKLSEQAESLIARIDEDKERLTGLQPTIKSGKDLTPVANELVNVASKSQDLLGKDNLSDAELNKLQKYNQEVKVLFEELGHPPIPPSNIFEKLKGDLGGIGKSAFEAVKGFLAFQAIITIQNSLSSFAQDAFKAYVEIDKLKTALSFSSGGTAGGATNLKFVNKEVDNLAIPLQASIKGFTQLASAARGTNLEGQQTKDIFDGLSKASTVLSLSADDTSSAFDAFSKAITQGKVSAETFEQLGTRIPGIYGVAARAIGTTEEEFKRLIETGQVGQDGIGRIGKQLQSEYGRDAEYASGNAQSAVFKLQNSSERFQEGLGEGIAPVVVPGLGLITEALTIAKNGVKELLALLASVATVLAVNVVNALRTVIVNLLAATTQAGTLGAGLRVLATTINNSFEIKLGAAIFGVIEIIKLLNDQVNTDLVKSFEDSADAATRAAEASEKAFEAEQRRRLGQKPLSVEEETPRASSGVGRFADDYLINPANFVLQHTFTNIPKLATTGESEKTRALDKEEVEQQDTTELLAGARLRENEVKNQSGGVGQLPAIDKELRDKSNEQQILAAEARRNFTDKGLLTPAKIKTQLLQDSKDINDLTTKRAEIAKPFDSTLVDLNQRYNVYKTKLEQLKDPVVINVLGQKKVDELTESYKKNIEAILLQKSSLAAAQAAFNVNPILTFTYAFRELTRTLASSQETNQLRATDRNFQSTQANLSGFATNRLAGKERSITDAITARDVAASDAENQQKLLDGLNKQLAAPGLQPQLQRLGVSPTSTAAKVSDVIAYTTDEADKAILEKIKTAREQELKAKTAKVTAVDADVKVKQVTQENTLSEIQFGAANVTARAQQVENVKTEAVKKGLQNRTISETEAAEKIARIQLNSTKIQQRNVDTQLAVLNEYHNQGKVGAEQFAERQRELTTEQTNLQKQSAEQQLAVFDATNARKLEALELANKKAEAVINQKQASGAIAIKQGVVEGRTDPNYDVPIQQNKVDQDAARGEIALINAKIEQNRYEKAQRIITAKTATENEIALKQQLAQADTKLIDLQIQNQEQLRARVEHNFQIEKQRLELKTVQATTEVKRGIVEAKLDSIEAPRKQNEIDQDAARKQIEFVKSEIAKTKELRASGLLSARAANEKELALNIELAQANQNLIDKQIQGQEQYRAAVEKTFQRRKQQLDLEVSQANTSIQQQFLGQFKEPEVDEKGLELAKTGVTLETQSTATTQQIGTLQEQLAGVDKLKLAEKDAADKKRELLAEIERLRQQQIQTEIDLIKNAREQEINGIERAQKAQENRFKLATGYLEQEKAGLELLNQSLERTNRLSQSRNDLSKAVSGAAVSGLEIRRDVANRALELSRKVSDPSTDPLIRNEATRQLQNAGFGTNELSILQQRQRIEDEIAKKKLEALKTEQEFQRESLQLDLKRQLIAAQTAEFEAESGQLTAQKARLDADAELRKAQIKKDPIEIQSAKVGVELAVRGIELADRRLESSKENVSVQEELALNATRSQQATQKGALAQEVAANNARKQANALESVEALANQVSKNLNPGGRSGTASDGENSLIPKKGEKPFDYNIRINRAKTFGEIQETKNTVNIAGSGFTVTPATVIQSSGEGPALALTQKTPQGATYTQFSQSLKSANQGIEERLDKIINSVDRDDFSLLPTDKSLKIDKSILRPDPTTGGKNTSVVKPMPTENIFEAYQRQREERFSMPVDKTADALANSTIKPVDTTTGFLQFTESLKSANQGIEQRLDKLLDSMATSNKTPRSLTVMSHSPIDDAASIINDLSRGELMGAGL